jgi:hypothetical protein
MGLSQEGVSINMDLQNFSRLWPKSLVTKPIFLVAFSLNVRKVCVTFLAHKISNEKTICCILSVAKMRSSFDRPKHTYISKKSS